MQLSEDRSKANHNERHSSIPAPTFLMCLYATVLGSVHTTNSHRGVFHPEEVRARGLEGSHAG